MSIHTFTLNGLTQSVDAEPEVPLIHALRNELQLHGAKLGCGLEQCGACTVLIDDQPAFACTTPVSAAAGREIRTIERLAGATGKLHPLQRAFLELNAAQCGFCTAGIVMRLVALLENDPRPNREQILEALDGHLCRCGAHPRILRAVDRAIAIMETDRT